MGKGNERKVEARKDKAWRRQSTRLWTNTRNGQKKKNFDLKLAFEKFDVNADGTIEPHELNMVLREIGIELNKQEMDLVFARFDPDGGGDIAYQKFAWVFNNREH